MNFLNTKLNITPYEISNLVANYQLNTGINIVLLAKYLPLNEYIVEIKVTGLVDRSSNTNIISDFD